MESTIAMCLYFFILYTLAIPGGYELPHFNDLPEHYVIGIHPLHIQANHGVLYTRLCGTCFTTHGRSITKQSTRSVPLALKLGSLLLLTCGEVQDQDQIISSLVVYVVSQSSVTKKASCVICATYGTILGVLTCLQLNTSDLLKMNKNPGSAQTVSFLTDSQTLSLIPL